MNDTVRKALQEARDYALADQQRGAKLLEQGREAVANLERAMADTQQRIADLNAALSGEVA